MRKELDEALCKKYPKIFAQRKSSIKVSCMPWGFECGDGWYWLIDNLCDSIQSYIDNNQHLVDFQVEASQVKEKFGTLRFYIEYVSVKRKKGQKPPKQDEVNRSCQLINGMIWLADTMSESICETCGSTKGRLVDGGWLVTVCPECEKKTRFRQIKERFYLTFRRIFRIFRKRY